jgi:hypothetical protein
MIDEPPFWIVWNPLHPETPRQQYKSRALATKAAKSMAEKHAKVGAFFFVMKAQSLHQFQGRHVEWTLAEWGIGAPCPYHHTLAQRRAPAFLHLEERMSTEGSSGSEQRE